MVVIRINIVYVGILWVFVRMIFEASHPAGPLTRAVVALYEQSIADDAKTQ